MGRMKFEKDIKKKIDRREIQPSQNAWARLENRLDEDEALAVTPGKVWFNYRTAAIIAGLGLALLYFMTTNNQATVEPQLVEQETESLEEDAPEIKEDILIPFEEENTFADKDKSQEIEGGRKEIQPDREKQEEIRLANAVVAEEATEKIESAELEVITPVQIDLETEKVNAIVAKVEEIKAEKGVVTDEELEALLAQAEKELNMKKALVSAEEDLSASALLESVEEELDQSFRERVFKALRTGFENVRTAVAERNN